MTTQDQGHVMTAARGPWTNKIDDRLIDLLGPSKPWNMTRRDAAQVLTREFGFPFTKGMVINATRRLGLAQRTEKPRRRLRPAARITIAKPARQQQPEPVKILSAEQIADLEAAEVRRIVAAREAAKDARIAARDARKTALKAVAMQEGPFFMFGRQMWPIPEGSYARYSFDQLLFSSLYFHSWWNILHHRSTDRRSLAITLRTNLKFLRMHVDRRLGPGDDKSEMGGFICVFEILCDAYQANPEGEFDMLHDICIKHDA